ncbi:MAG: undecaprenyl/decaprenyl-phosphate alpha-N-acetylglucosaminyl 1-phosphate transferase [Desulfobacteraceae bacterium]|nr:MAG: undecaprenyl/decaprenyl-phosphate alpha-N-acetylglucosaminyl 1-phosphate transferase [Desulfobacteraceae bacterium]
MATVAFVLLLSLGVTLLLTPMIRETAKRFGWVDAPSDRKVHVMPMPRLGGIGMYLGVYSALLFFLIFPNKTAQAFFNEPVLIWIITGSTLVFLMGVWDDLGRLNPLFKLMVQAVAAGIAYYGGIRIVQLETPWGSVISFGLASLPVTIFWFLLVINAINLIDGLDGLAAGVSLFATLSLLVICFMGGKLAVCFGLAALAGACLGFLRYNFNPASIFMGDGGSYFLGYMLAALSILGAMESHTTVAILIPIIALGVPLMDTLLAPVRRFILGKRLFQPDKSHIHHRLLKRGFSHRKAVLVMYGATVCMGLFALIGVHAVDGHAGLFLFALGVLLFICVRQLGYLEYLAVDKVLGYVRDVTDEIGLQRGRRTFLGRQKAIGETRTVDEMWHAIVAAVESLDVDYAEVRLNGNGITIPASARFTWFKSDETILQRDEANDVLSVCLPLINHRYHGTLFIKKDMARAPLSQHTLRRLEQLRRTIVERLMRFEVKVEKRSAFTSPLLPIKSFHRPQPVAIENREAICVDSGLGQGADSRTSA